LISSVHKANEIGGYLLLQKSEQATVVSWVLQPDLISSIDKVVPKDWDDGTNLVFEWPLKQAVKISSSVWRTPWGGSCSQYHLC